MLEILHNSPKFYIIFLQKSGVNFIETYANLDYNSLQISDDLFALF